MSCDFSSVCNGKTGSLHGCLRRRCSMRDCYFYSRRARRLGGLPVSNRLGRSGHKRVNAGDEKHTGSDHGSGMNESADGRGAFHGIRQPNMQGQLTGFTDCAAENKKSDTRGGGQADAGGLRYQLRESPLLEAALTSVIIEEERTGLRVEPNHSQKESQVTDARRDECFLCRRSRARFVIPEANEEVRSQ